MNERTGIRSLCLLLLAAAFVFSPASRAQTNAEDTPGINSGNYNVQETVEVGYRKTGPPGTRIRYDTFVDLGTGLRLLDYTLDMRSLNHQGIFFDNLSFSNFGYGGDPDNVSRLRIKKNKLYDFSLVFRRDKNFWDYSLLGNPLNPVPLDDGEPGVPESRVVSFVRREHFAERALSGAAHAGLRLDAASRNPACVSGLGYSRDVNEGPSLNSFAGTTNFLLAQNFRMTTNAYHMGVDFRVLPKTTISYDSSWTITSRTPATLWPIRPSWFKPASFPGRSPLIWEPIGIISRSTRGTPCGASLACRRFQMRTSHRLGLRESSVQAGQSLLEDRPRAGFPAHRAHQLPIYLFQTAGNVRLGKLQQQQQSDPEPE